VITPAKNPARHGGEGFKRGVKEDLPRRPSHLWELYLVRLGKKKINMSATVQRGVNKKTTIKTA